MGDKTRMQHELSVDDLAFIRPSPTSGSLGGVAKKLERYTRETAGYEVILIETVGVGQSETAVHSMVGRLCITYAGRAGDELQGIKRGIMEMSDILLINKADGNNLVTAKKAQAQYKSALHLFPLNPMDGLQKLVFVRHWKNNTLTKLGKLSRLIAIGLKNEELYKAKDKSKTAIGFIK